MIETMRERITIQKSKTGNDKNGNHTLLWEDYFSCYAYVNNLSGNEYWAAAQVNAQTDLFFVVRYCSEIKEMDSEHYRIIFRDQIYNISFVDNVQYQNKTVKLRASLGKEVRTWQEQYQLTDLLRPLCLD